MALPRLLIEWFHSTKETQQAREKSKATLLTGFGNLLLVCCMKFPQSQELVFFLKRLQR